MMPTFLQAQDIARVLYVPLGYLYLQTPPVEKLPLADLRAAGRTKPSADLLDLLSHTLDKQQWFREYQVSEDAEELPFVGRFDITHPEAAVAGDMRDVLDVEGARQQASGRNDFMRNIIHNAEASGIMVMRSGVVDYNPSRPLKTDEFRGFSICDRVAPLVFVNARDFPDAQIFTLAHEMV